MLVGSRRLFHSFPPYPTAELRKELYKLEGGSVDLTMGDNSIGRLVLNYPQHCNALSGRMMTELDDAVHELQAWSSGRGVLLYGAENKANYFCSGGHLETGRRGETIGICRLYVYIRRP